MKLGFFAGLTTAPENGKELASASADKSVRLWDVTSHSEIETLRGHSGWVYTVAFCPNDSKLLASGSGDGEVIFWKLSRQTELDRLSNKNGMKALAFSPDGRSLVTLGFQDLFDDLRGAASVSVWDLSTGRSTLLNGRECLRSIEVSSDWELVALGKDGGVHLWDLRTLEELEPPPLPNRPLITAITFSPNNESFAVGREDGEIVVWSRSQNRSVFNRHAMRKGVTGLAFGPNHNMLAVSRSRSVEIWNLLSGEMEGLLEMREGTVSSLAFKTSSCLACGTDKGSITLWDWSLSHGSTTTMKVKGDVLLFADGARTAITNNNGVVGFWDTDINQERFWLRYDECYCLAVSPDGRTLATGTSWDGKVRLWFAATPEQVEASNWWRDVVK